MAALKHNDRMLYMESSSGIFQIRYWKISSQSDITLIECENDSDALTLFLPAITLTCPAVESAAASSIHDSIHFQPPA